MPEFYQSTVGKKIIVALTGIVLLGFVVVHMLGNLKAFLGIDAASGMHSLDLYAAFLRSVGHEFMGRNTALWLTRAVLLGCVSLHVLTVYQLRRINAFSRPVDYAQVSYSSATTAARSMWWGGLFLALFIVFHILHFTTGQLHFDGFVEGQVYSNVFRAFRHWPILGIYVAGMLALGLHVFHGGWSLFQTLGLDAPERNFCLRSFARVLALLIFVGFMSVPLAMFSGILSEPPRQMAVFNSSH